MANVLVVGGAGYAGGWLCDRLATAHHVRVFDSLLYEDAYLKPVDFAWGDVRDEAALAPHLRWADAVVWLAALVGDAACAFDPWLTREINVESVRRLRQTFDRRIVYLSTCSVYGATDGLLHEDSPTQPLSLYARTKLEAEELLAPADAVVFRLATLFGLGDRYSRIRMDLVVNALTIKAALYGRISIVGEDQYRPLLHVRDVADAVLAAVQGPQRGLFNLHAVNLRIGEIGDRLAETMPGLEVRRDAAAAADHRSYRVSSDKARDAFAFSPRRTLAEGMGEILALARDRRIRDVSNPRYSNAEFLRPLLVTPRTPLGFEVTGASRPR